MAHGFKYLLSLNCVSFAFFNISKESLIATGTSSGAYTPNMHLHCHLLKYIQDVGPEYSSFWCFSFKRYNGVLEGMQKTWHAPEIQLIHKIANMQNILHLDFSSPYSCSKEVHVQKCNKASSACLSCDKWMYRHQQTRTTSTDKVDVTASDEVGATVNEEAEIAVVKN